MTSPAPTPAPDRRRRAAISAAAAAEARHVLSAERQRRWEAAGTRLSREELVAGVACRGCGLPMADGLGGWSPTLRMDEREREAYEQSDAAFKAAHPDCRAARWTIAGSRTWHCSACCPPPPLGGAQIDQLTSLLSQPRRPASEMRVWDVELSCGHHVDAARHMSTRGPDSSGIHSCPICNVERAGLEATLVRDSAEPEGNAAETAAEAEVARARKRLKQAERKLAATRRKTTG